MRNIKKINLKEIKEAIKQADANIKFEEVKENLQTKELQNNIKILKRRNDYDRQTLG